MKTRRLVGLCGIRDSLVLSKPLQMSAALASIAGVLTVVAVASMVVELVAIGEHVSNKGTTWKRKLKLWQAQ